MESSWKHWDVAQQVNEEILHSNLLGSPRTSSSVTEPQLSIAAEPPPTLSFIWKVNHLLSALVTNSSVNNSWLTKTAILDHHLAPIHKSLGTNCLASVGCVLANHLEGTIEDAENSNSIIQGGWVPAFQNLGGQASQGAMFLYILVISTQYFWVQASTSGFQVFQT